MANNIKIESIYDVLGLVYQFTITLNSLASGSARQSTLIDNTDPQYPAGIVHVGIKSGTAPTAGGVYEVYLLRANKRIADPPTYISDNGGVSDAAITILNAQLLGVVQVTNSANTTFYGDFDTSQCGPLGPCFGIAIKNSSDQALNGSTAKVVCEIDLYNYQIQ